MTYNDLDLAMRASRVDEIVAALIKAGKFADVEERIRFIGEVEYSGEEEARKVAMERQRSWVQAAPNEASLPGEVICWICDAKDRGTRWARFIGLGGEGQPLYACDRCGTTFTPAGEGRA